MSATTRLRSMRQTASQTTLGTLETLRLVRGQLSHTSNQTNGNYQVTLAADPLAGPSGTLSAFKQVLVTTVTTLINHYFENLNVTMGNSAT